MQIDIHIPRPVLTISLVVAFAAGALWFHMSGSPSVNASLDSVNEVETVSVVASSSSAASSQPAQPQAGLTSPSVQYPMYPMGFGMNYMPMPAYPMPYGLPYQMPGMGYPMPYPQAPVVQQAAQSSSESSAASSDARDAGEVEKISEAENRVRQARMEQEFLKKREEILRYQLQVLAEEKHKLGDSVSPEVEEQFRTSTKLLTSLLLDRKKAEQFLLSAFNEIWEAEGRATALGIGLNATSGTFTGFALWPIQPLLGISAVFHDAGYQERFGFSHQGIDIPVMQGTEVRAAADGVVKDSVDHGLGFNYVTIQHEGGASTLYGHLSKMFVVPGDKVLAGDPIGLSGGRPGTAGAGFSTGPHLHFELHLKGQTIDPIPYLPESSAIQ